VHCCGAVRPVVFVLVMSVRNSAFLLPVVGAKLPEKKNYLKNDPRQQLS
jgi:hypothetical protein